MGIFFPGEFDLLVLTMVGILGEAAYGNAIVAEIDTQISRKVNLNTVHIALYRLEEKGFLQSHYGGATSLRGGRRKRLFRITNSGIKLLKEQKEQKMRLWDLVPGLKMSYL